MYTNNCSIKDLYQKKCVSNYQYEETNANLILNIIFNELSNEYFNTSIFDINQSINIIENWTSFTIMNIKSTDIINSDINQCIKELKDYYEISEEKNIIIMRIGIKKEGYNTKEKYEIYSQLNGNKLERLNLNKCSNTLYNTKCDLYSIDSIINNLCISCQNDFYEKENDLSNIYPYINCYNSIEGYYLDNNKYFK